MEALKASYGDGSSDSDSESAHSIPTSAPSAVFTPLPPPPISLLDPPSILDLQIGQTTRLRSFPHVDGNYALHVYIPKQDAHDLAFHSIWWSSRTETEVYISSPSKKELVAFLKKISSREPRLNVVDVDVPLNILCQNDEKLEQVTLGREFHISLGRTVPIRVHQIDSVVSMLRQKLQIQHQYWIDFNKWEVFVNDDHTRSFLSAEVVQGGLVEITKQIEVVNAIYRLHNLPEFYKDPRPHISLAWALGDIAHSLKKIVDEEMKCAVGKSLKKCIFSCKFKSIECKIGKKAYTICKISDGQ
ncbi:U6 snRNA phosphodiesterase [Glycine max]|nr:U6 snRNA phosphodiesterase [Glycine max]KAH1265256.1 U6 snRNA phosphodiesterase [Glycine max]KAH1265258.1 U6 snRNA phosphodiesterase [Glycine max]